MSEAASNLEGLLHEALSPVDPPADLVTRLENALTSLTEIAVEELEAWELSAMRDPRNWVRPAGAVIVGGSAGIALMVLRTRHRGAADTPEVRGVRSSAERALGGLRAQAHRILGGDR